jgi:uncharacterized protein (DUF1330 family)
MPAYVISEVEILDEALGQRYRDLAAASVALHGGRYIVRGGQPEVPEGQWPAQQQLVVVEFPTMQGLHDWYGSAEYAQALALRQSALERRLLFVEGAPQPRPENGSARKAPAASGESELGAEVHEAEVESRWEAAPAVVAVIGLQLVLAMVSEQLGWKLWGLPWWVWLCTVGPELALLLTLAFDWPRHQLEQMGRRRTAAVTLLAVVSASNTLALVALVGSLLSGDEKSGAELLFKGVTIWSTNVITFGLWYWGFDRGGPIKRIQADAPLPDFQFPQLENPHLAPKDWHPRLLDYVYFSFSNSIAFSPTDVMPLSQWAKSLMLTESAISAVTVLLVAARSVNIFK